MPQPERQTPPAAPAAWNDRGWQAAILLAVLAAHAVWVLSDARFLDGTYFEYLAQIRNWDVLAEDFYSLFLHPWAWMYLPFLGTESVGWTLRCVEWLSLGVIALSVWRMARRHGGLKPGEACFLALAVGLFPAYGAAMMSNTFLYILPTALFYAAWSLALDHALAPGGASRVKQALSLALLEVSFFHNSLIAFHGGFLGLLLLLSWRADAHAPRRPAGWAAWLVRLAWRNAPLLLAPILFLAARSTYFLLSDIPTQHYHFQPDLLRVWRAFAGNSFHHLLLNMMGAVYGQPWLAAAAACIAGFFLIRKTADERWRILWLAGLGGFLAFVAIAPYALVLRAAPLQSFGARYGILAALGGGMILTAAWLCLPARRAWRLYSALFLLGGLAWQGIGDDLMWMGRWAKDRAMIAALREMPPPPDGTVLLLDDPWRIGRESYRSFELSWFFIQAWGRSSWVGIDLLDRDPVRELNEKMNEAHPYSFDFSPDFKPNGCRMRLMPTPTDPIPDPRALGLGYLVSRYWRGMDEASPLAGKTRVLLSEAECRETP